MIYRKDRLDGLDPHGGVLLGIKASLNPTFETNDSENEVLMTPILVNGEKVKVIGAYRTPSMSTTQNETFVDFLSNKLNDCPKFILLGDLNYPGIDWVNYSGSNREENLFIDFVNQNHLLQKVDSPTRGDNILDICLVTDDALVSDLSVCHTFSTSDHNYFICNLHIYTIPEPCRTFYNFENADWESMRLFFACVDWRELFQHCTCSEMWNIFIQTIQQAEDLFVPVITINNNEKPWFNQYLHDLVKRKQSTKESFYSNKSDSAPNFDMFVLHFKSNANCIK